MIHSHFASMPLPISFACHFRQDALPPHAAAVSAKAEWRNGEGRAELRLRMGVWFGASTRGFAVLEQGVI